MNSTHSLTPYKAFPVHCLPATLGELVGAGSRSIGCDPAVIALPALTAIGVAVGNHCRIEVKRDWLAPPIVWTVVAMPSGRQKSPALDLVVNPFRQLQGKAHEEFRQTNEERKNSQFQPDTCWTDDATTEGLAQALSKNPRGILYASDELSGWLGAFGAYKNGGRTTDEAFFCSRYGARASHAIRKTGDQRAVFADGLLGITGVATIATLSSLIVQSTRDSGLLARLLISSPPPKPRRWSDDTVRPKVLAQYEAKVRELVSRNKSRTVRMSPEAKRVFKDFFDLHNKELEQKENQDLAAAFSKMEELPCRLALIFHVVDGGDEQVTEDTMKRAIEVTEWFKHEAKRVYSMLEESQEDCLQRGKQEKILAYLERQEQPVTARDVQTGCRFLKSSQETTEALEALVATSQVTAENRSAGAVGGRPTRCYSIAGRFEPAPSAQPPETRGKQGCADADACREERPWEVVQPI